MRMSVLLWGTLEGMGRSVPCELIAIKTAPTNAVDQPQYSHCSIVKAPANLPDGEYLLRFAGLVTTVQRRESSWIVGEAPVTSGTEPTATASLAS